METVQGLGTVIKISFCALIPQPWDQDKGAIPNLNTKVEKLTILVLL